MTSRSTTTRRRLLAAVTAFALAGGAAACGGDDETTTADTVEAGSSDTEAVDETAAETAPDDTAAPDGTDTPVSEPAADTTPAGDGTWDPGDVQMRVINMLDEPVDVYVRTTGFIEAYSAFPGVEPGTITELIAPPAEGSLVVTVAGAGDPECVISCAHFIAEIGATLPEGPVRTLLLHDLDGSPSSFDFWESPTAERLGNSNSMPPADPAAGLVVVTAVALTGADFGLRLGFADSSGCVEPTNLANVLVGGNQTPAFAYTALTADVSLFDNNDRECAGPTLGGPFTVAGGPGTRTHLILTGEPGDMDGIVLPMAGDEAAAQDALDAASSGESSTGSTGDGTAETSADRDTAIELMAVEVQGGLGIPADQSACVAGLLVDAIGVDVVLVDGELIDLDTLPVEYEQPAIDAIVASVDECGVDPALVGA